MRSLWVALVLLLLYALLVFLGSRIIDLFLWCHSGTQFVDPFVLSVRQLKQLLENRGVSYTGYVEKQELAQLVKESADVSDGEVSTLNSNGGGSVEAERERLTSTPRSSEFVSSAHFYEQVEDTKDSVWLIQVLPAAVGKESSEPLLDDYTWRRVRAHLEPFAIRTGVLDCNYDRRLCRSKGWFEPLLLLALPKGTKPKDKVILRSSQLTRPQAIIEWLREELSIRVHKVADLKELDEDWLSSRGSDGIKVLLLTHLLHPPLFLAALSIKFSGRIKFGMLTVRKEEEAELLRKRSDLGGHVPGYVVVTPEKTVVYGRRRNEHFNYAAMNAFLCTVQPELNDVFLITLILVNMLVALRILLVDVDLWWKRVVCALWTTVSHNLFLFWAWILVLGVHRWPLFGSVASYCLLVARYVGMSELGSLLRADCQLMAKHQLFFTGLFLIYGFFGNYLLEHLETNSHLEDSSQQEERGWWEVLPLDCLFRPTTTNSPSSTSSSSSSTPTSSSPTASLRSHQHQQQRSHQQLIGDVELEFGLDLLMERLVVPNLWLQPSLHPLPSSPPDYIAHLPVWKFKMATDASTIDSSDEEKIVKLMDDGWETTPTPYTAPHSMLPTSECAVCLEAYASDDLLCGLPCAHNYHQRCLLSWLQTDNHHCPICRWPSYKAHPRSSLTLRQKQH